MLHALELSGVLWAEAQEFPGLLSLCPGTWYALGLGVAWDPSEDPDIGTRG